MNRSTFSLLLVLALAALFLADAKDMQTDSPPSGLRRAVDSERARLESWLDTMQDPSDPVETHPVDLVITCPCSCAVPYGRRFVGAEDAGEGAGEGAEEGVLIQLIPIPGSPPEYTQICLLQDTATPVLNEFPLVVWW